MDFTLKTNEDFVVREVISEKFARKFSRTSKGVSRIDGPFSVYLMKKSGENTKDAILKINDRTGKDVGYAGLKDKNAVTYQYITIKDADFEDMDMGNIALSFVSKSQNAITIGDLKGNNFEITLHDFGDHARMEDAIKHASSKGFPNLFGKQRFGRNMDNYLIGRHIVKGNMKKAMEMMDAQEMKPSKDMTKFFIHSYQSWIFNSVLIKCIEKSQIPDQLPIVGYGSKIDSDIVKNILEKECISPKDFMINELSICCRGGMRDTFVKTKIEHYFRNSSVTLKFFLPKGCYATQLLEEIRKF